jgi:hypothetical protein
MLHRGRPSDRQSPEGAPVRRSRRVAPGPTAQVPNDRVPARRPAHSSGTSFVGRFFYGTGRRARKWRPNPIGLRGQIDWLLQDLGPTDEVVARSLESAGVKGVTKNSDECAIARYMNAVTGSDRRVSTVTVADNAITANRRLSWMPSVVVPLPPAVYRFVIRFDRGDFVRLLTDPPDLSRNPDSGSD